MAHVELVRFPKDDPEEGTVSILVDSVEVGRYPEESVQEHYELIARTLERLRLITV